MIALTEIQKNILIGLMEHRGWQPGCGWVYKNESTTLRALKSLITKGFVYAHNDFYTAIKDPAGNTRSSSSALQCQIAVDNALARVYGRGIINVIVKPYGENLFIATGISPAGLTHTIHLQSDLLSPIALLFGDNNENSAVATLERLVEQITAQRLSSELK